MEENKNGYDPSEYEEEEDYAPAQEGSAKSIRGYRIVINAGLIRLNLYFAGTA